ncbi:ATP-binding protein, partial [Pseudomonas aeruginosa]
QRLAQQELIAAHLAGSIQAVLHPQSLALDTRCLAFQQGRGDLPQVDLADLLQALPLLHLGQALANLLDNALDFTPPGGILRLLAEADGEGIALRLFNQGPAIPDYALARLTERFYSLPRPASGRKSTGLGLNFVAGVAQLDGGRLHVG